MRYTRSFSLLASFIIGLVSVSFITDSKKNQSIIDKSPNGSLATPFIIDTLQYPSETHLKNVQQLTFGGDNAEAYFSFDSKWIIFQRTKANEGVLCDQIFIGKVPKPARSSSIKW